MNRFSLAAVFAGCLWGTTGLFSRYMDPLGFSPLDMLIVRCGIAALLFGLLILLKDVRLFRIRWKDLWLFLAVGLTGQLMFSYCYYTAIDMMSISTALRASVYVSRYGYAPGPPGVPGTDRAEGRPGPAAVRVGFGTGIWAGRLPQPQPECSMDWAPGCALP